MPVLVWLVRRIGGQRWFAVVGQSFVPLDRLFGRLTRGRFVALGLRELPSLLLTATGRRSGRARTSPLLYATDGHAFVVVGSNWGKQRHPAWSANLLANRDAIVIVRGRKIAVRARLTTGAERERLWQLLQAIWPAYATYEQRATGREIRVFRLELTE